MGDVPSDRHRVLDRVESNFRGAVIGEIESVVVTRLSSVSGVVGRIARARALYSSIAGPIGMALDIIDMAAAGYQAMTTQRRIMSRVAAAHAYGYWCFKHTNPRRPVNPPNSFLVMHREQDANDADIGARIGREDYSSDSGFTSRDWNRHWRSAALDRLDTLESHLRMMARRGILQRKLRDTIGPVVHGETYEVMANQYRAIFLASKFGSPSVAASCYLLCSLQGVADIEKEATIRFYQRFPYEG